MICLSMYVNVCMRKYSPVHLYAQNTNRIHSKRRQYDLSMAAEVAARRHDAAARRAQHNEDRAQFEKLKSEGDTDELLQMQNYVDGKCSESAPIPLRSITPAEKRHVIDTLLATPRGSKARSVAMDNLHAQFQNLEDPPFLSSHYRNVWSQWCTASSKHTKTTRGLGRVGRPRGVTLDDALENLDDIHGYWLRTGNGAKRHQVRTLTTPSFPPSPLHSSPTIFCFSLGTAKC